VLDIAKRISGTRDIGECPYSRADLGVRAIQTKYDGGGLLVDDDDDNDDDDCCDARGERRHPQVTACFGSGKGEMSLNGIYARAPSRKDDDYSWPPFIDVLNRAHSRKLRIPHRYPASSRRKMLSLVKTFAIIPFTRLILARERERERERGRNRDGIPCLRAFITKR